MEISWSARPLPRDYSHDDDNENEKKNEYLTTKKRAVGARCIVFMVKKINKNE